MNTKSMVIVSLLYAIWQRLVHQRTNWKVQRVRWFQRLAAIFSNWFCTWTFKWTIRCVLWHRMRRVAFCESKSIERSLHIQSVVHSIDLNSLLSHSCSSNPKKRYELFLKATQLDVIIEKLNSCLHQTTAAKAKYMAQKKQNNNLRDIQKKAHEKLNQFKSMEPLKVRMVLIWLLLS